MLPRTILIAIAVALTPVSANRYREYMEECVLSYKALITQICTPTVDPTIPCLSDDVLDRYNNDTALAVIKLGFECCDKACNHIDIIRLSCCDNIGCYRRCKGKPPKIPLPEGISEEEGKAAAFRRLRQLDRQAALAYARQQMQ